MVSLAIQDPYFKPEYGAELDPDYFQQRPALFFPCNEGGGSKLHDPSDDRITGTFNGGVTWAPSSKGIVPSLDGSTGYIEFPRLGLFDGTKPWAVHAQVNASTFGSSARMIFHPRAERDVFLRWNNNNSSFEFGWFSGVTTGATFASPVANRWYDLWGVWDIAASLVRLYVDGKPVSTASTGAPNVVTDKNTIGTQFFSGVPNNSWIGLIDQPLILPYAPTPQQIADIYANPWGMFAPAEPRAWCFGATRGDLLLRRRRAAA